MKPGNRGVNRLIKAWGYSMLGFKAAFQHEAAFRQELALLVVSLPAAYYFAETPFEVAILLASVLLILVVELLNSALEAVVDRFGGEFHELSGRAKDLASAAVLVSIFISAILWFSVIFF